MTVSLISALWYLLTCPIQYGYVAGACHINSGVAPLSNDAAGDLTFTFPYMPQPGPWTRQQYHSANYLTTNFTTPLTGYSTLTLTLGTTGTGSFYYQFDPDNCPSCYPAHVRAYIERQGDNGVAQNFRWWSDDPYSYELDAFGTVTLVIPFDPAVWSNVNGQSGTQQPAGFAAALAHPMQIGVTFGGGYFFGHGVNVDAPAQFVLESMSIQ